jgi:hypothetical protein
MLLAFSADAHAASTSLSMQSDPGDYIGGGQDHLYTPAAGEFTTPETGEFVQRDFMSDVVLRGSR